MYQGSDFIEAKQKSKRLYDEHTEITGEESKPIPLAQQVRQRLDQQFEGLKEHNTRFEPRTGWQFYPSSRPTHSSGSECPSYGPVIPFGSMVEYHPISAEDLSRLHQFGPEVLRGIFLVSVLSAGRIWKIGGLEPMHASALHGERLNAKEVLTPMRGEKFMFPVADGTVKLSGGDQDLRTSTFTRERPEWGEEQEILQRNSDEWYAPLHLQEDSARDDEEVKKWFLGGHRIIWLPPSRGTLSQTVRAERRIISYSVEVYRRYQNHTYVPGCIVGTTHWRLLECRWRKRIVRCMDRLHKIYSITTKATRRVHLVRVETYKKTIINFSSRWYKARYVETCVWCSEIESKTKMGCRETKDRQCQTIERNILHRTRWRRFQAHDECRSEKVGRSDDSSNALQRTDKE